MPVSVAGASAATFAQRHAGARPQPVSRPPTTSEDGAVTTEMRSSLLRGCAVVKRCRRPSRISSSLARLQGTGRPWPRGMKEQPREHSRWRHRRRQRRLEHVTSRRATGEELTSSACATQEIARAGGTVRCRRSSAGLGRLSRCALRRRAEYRSVNGWQKVRRSTQ